MGERAEPCDTPYFSGYSLEQHFHSTTFCVLPDKKNHTQLTLCHSLPSPAGPTEGYPGQWYWKLLGDRDGSAGKHTCTRYHCTCIITSNLFWLLFYQYVGNCLLNWTFKNHPKPKFRNRTKKEQHKRNRMRETLSSLCRRYAAACILESVTRAITPFK